MRTRFKISKSINENCILLIINIRVIKTLSIQDALNFALFIKFKTKLITSITKATKR